MQKQAPSFGRVLTMVLFALSCFGLLLFLWLSFGGATPLKPQSYRFKIAFPEATNLALEADVRVAGVPVGKVRGKELAPGGNRTLATIEVEPKFAPIKKDAVAILRQKTLLGETYVELTPGSRNSESVPEEGTLANGQVKETVELDEIFTALDPITRQAFRTWQQDLAESFRGRDQAFSDALGNLPSFAVDATTLLKVLDEEAEPLQRVIRDTGSVFAALTQDEAALANLITSSAGVFEATASQNNALAETFRVFPTFLDESKRTLERLRIFALDTRPLIRDLKPATRDLRFALVDVRHLAPDLRNFFRDLSPLIDASVEGLPALRDTLRGAQPLLAETGPFLSQLNPILQWLELNQKLVSDFIQTAAGGLAARTTTSVPGGPGHYLRQISPSGSETLGIHRTRLSTNRGNTYLEPLFAANQRALESVIFPNWDCNNTGVGEKPPTISSTPGQASPACFVQPPFNFQGQSEAFPRIDANNYAP